LRGKGKGMACCTQGLPLLITSWLWPEAKSQAEPGQKKPGWARPKLWPELAFGPAWVLGKPKPLA